MILLIKSGRTTIKNKKFPMLRCTLMGLEKGYRNLKDYGIFSKINESSQIKTHTVVLFGKNYSTLSMNNLDP